MDFVFGCWLPFCFVIGNYKGRLILGYEGQVSVMVVFWLFALTESTMTRSTLLITILSLLSAVKIAFGSSASSRCQQCSCPT